MWNISVFSIFVTTATGYITNTFTELTTEFGYTTSTITTTASTVAVSTQTIPFPIGIPGFPVESVALGLLFGILALMLLRRRQQTGDR